MKIKRKTKIQNMIPVASMSDIAFLLLIFLMLSSIMDMKKNIEVNTPKAKQVSTSEEVQKYEIIIDKNGTYYFEGKAVSLEHISSFFSLKILVEPNLYVQLNADEDCIYERIGLVVKTLQDVKCYRLLFISKRIKEELRL